MIEIARLPADDRRELFHNTAAKTGLHDAIVEKDFWVCLTLDYLFHRSPWKKAVTFKGGTSLSRTPSRTPSIKRRTERPRFSWQKPSARRSGKGFLLNWAFRPIFT